MLPIPKTHRIATTEARDQLPTIVHFVQDPRATCILTRHGKDVAAIISMAELRRIYKQQDIEEITEHGHRPAKFTFGKEMHLTNAEAAEHVQRVQMDRLTEREVLKKAGLEPVPGGELVEEMEVVREVGRKRRWWFFW